MTGVVEVDRDRPAGKLLPRAQIQILGLWTFQYFP